MESLEKLEFEVNIDINSKFFLYQGHITNLNVDVIVNETFADGGGIDTAIYETVELGLLDEFQKFNCRETGEYKVTFGCKLIANYVFHSVRPRDKNDCDSCKNCLQKVLAENVKSIAFCCVATAIPRFDQKKAAKMKLLTVRLLLEANHSSTDYVIFCTYENADCVIYKALFDR